MRTFNSFLAVLAAFGTIGVAATVSGCGDSQPGNLLADPSGSTVQESSTHRVGDRITMTANPLSSTVSADGVEPAPIAIKLHITSPPEDASTIVTATHITEGIDKSKYTSTHHSKVPEYYTQYITIIWEPVKAGVGLVGTP
jgi:hypothetical protein